MNRTAAINLVRTALGGAILLILAIQVLFLPWLSGEVARDLPDEAFMRWPTLGLAITGLATVQVALVCLMRLLLRVRRGILFHQGSLRWVDGIIGAFIAGAAVCAATLVYQSQTVGGPPLWAMALLLGILGGITMALLTWIGRTILVEVTSARGESVSAAPLPPASAHT